MRIVSVPVYDRGAFRSLIRGATTSRQLFRWQGSYWQLLRREEGISFYCRSRLGLRWIQSRVEEYELEFYDRLARGYVGRDGQLRMRHPRKPSFTRLPLKA